MKNLKRLTAIAFFSLLAVIASAQRIAVLSDIHVSPGNEAEKALRQAVAEINADAFDMVFVIGDLTNEGSDAELVNVKSILDSVAHPLYVIPGNHESTWSQSATKTFADLWGTDRFVVETDSLVFVAIASGPYMKMGDGHIKTEDLSWIGQVVEKPVAEGKKVVSLNHYPLLDDLDNFHEYMAVLDRYPVALHLNGHYHRWIPYTAGREEGTVPGQMLRALHMGKGNYGYSIVEFTPRWVHVYDKPNGAAAVPMAAYPLKAGYEKVKQKPVEWSDPEGFAVREVWADDASIFGRPAVVGSTVYFGNSQGKLRAVDARGASLLWEVPVEGAVFSRAMPLPGGKVAFPTATGITVVGKDGRVSRTLPSREGPYVADGRLTSRGWLQGGYKRIEMRRPSDGKVVWTYDSLFNYCQGEPAVEGDDVVFGAWDTNLRCVGLRDGRLHWVWNNGKSNNLLGPGNVVPAICGDKVVIVAPDRYMTAIDRATGTTLWRDNSHRYRESMGRSADGSRVYAKTMDGELVAVDATSPEFKELWTLDLGLGYEHAPCPVYEKDGIVYVGSRRGIVTAVDPDSRKVLWSLPLGSSEVNGFEAGDDGTVYVTLVEGKVYAVSRR